jgi:hypothetical protein
MKYEIKRMLTHKRFNVINRYNQTRRVGFLKRIYRIYVKRHRPDAIDDINEIIQKTIAAMGAQTFSSYIGQQMANPIRAYINYQSIASKIINVTPMPQGATPIYYAGPIPGPMSFIKRIYRIIRRTK